MIQLTTSGMSGFIVIAIVVALILFAFNYYNEDKDVTAIKLRKDGKPEYYKVPAESRGEFPLFVKIAIFILIASVLYMPLDFILNRS